jgi:hypothetical protein
MAINAVLIGMLGGSMLFAGPVIHERLQRLAGLRRLAWSGVWAASIVVVAFGGVLILSRA